MTSYCLWRHTFLRCGLVTSCLFRHVARSARKKANTPIKSRQTAKYMYLSDVLQNWAYPSYHYYKCSPNCIQQTDEQTDTTDNSINLFAWIGGDNYFKKDFSNNGFTYHQHLKQILKIVFLEYFTLPCNKKNLKNYIDAIYT